jgi:hypothetical protein
VKLNVIDRIEEKYDAVGIVVAPASTSCCCCCFTIKLQ